MGGGSRRRRARDMAVPNSAWQHGIDSKPRKNPLDVPEGIQRVFLLRLRRLTWLRRSCSGQLEETILRVLDKAIYSTFCDCVELGVESEARELLNQPA